MVTPCELDVEALRDNKIFVTQVATRPKTFLQRRTILRSLMPTSFLTCNSSQVGIFLTPRAVLPYRRSPSREMKKKVKYKNCECAARKSVAEANEQFRAPS